MSQKNTTLATTSNKSSKDILARAMAQEDIFVEHSAAAETAAFDVKSRRLILPVWKDMDDALYDMLVGHEVSHALHTPATGWQEFVGNGPQAGVRHMFVNVVEDARIERMIKDKFPGLRRDFSAAYASMHERDLFQIAGKDLTDLPLIDRLNLHFKIGLFGLETITFSPDEQQYVTRMAETKTFEEVVVLAEELYELWKSDQPESEQPEEGEEGEEGGDGEGQGPSGESGEEDQDGPQGQGGPGGESGEGEQEDGENGEGGEGGDSDAPESEGEGGESAGGEDSGDSMEDDTDDGESAEGETKSGDQSGENGETNRPMSYDDYSNQPGLPGSTQQAMEQGVSDLRDEYAKETAYFDLPTANLEEIVIDFESIAAEWTRFAGEDHHYGYNGKGQAELRAERDAQLATYRNSIKGTVSQMVQQFQMKQAADADKRTSVAKTGVLDPVAMINYRWSEDIFLKNEVHADGKNHGMIMYVDWSGSMQDILNDTLDQLLVLVEFCRKVGIPYEVYAFSSIGSAAFAGVDIYNDWNASEEYRKSHPQWNVIENDPDDRWSNIQPHEFSLLNFLSSRMNKRQFESALKHLWYVRTVENYYRDEVVAIPRTLSLGSTPLNEAIICAMQQVPEFQSANGIQIVNTVFLTDGEGHQMLPYYSRNDAYLRDRKTRKTHRMGNSNETEVFLTILKEKTGCNTVGIRLHNSKNVTNMFRYRDGISDDTVAELNVEYKKNNFCIHPQSSYDEYYIVQGNTEVVTDAMEGLDSDASMTRIKNAFIKGGNKKKASRVIANRMVDIFAA